MFSAVLVGLLAAGCSTNPVTGRREFIFISTEQEIMLGEEAAGQFEQDLGGPVPSGILQSYVRRIGKEVSDVSDRPMPYEFTLLASDVPNAFALPGGKIFITAGLMRRMTNERQLAAVLGHETVHVAAKHNVKGMQQQLGTSVFLDIVGRLTEGTDAAIAQDVAKITTTMYNLKYSREDEYEADVVGIKYMTRAGYNPWGMVEMLTVLRELSESEPGAFGEMFQTHPLTSKRIDQARETIREGNQYARFSSAQPDPNAGRFLEMREILVGIVGRGD